MKLTNLNPENLVKLCEMRLNHKKHNFTEILIEDDSFKYFNGVSFVVKSNEFDDEYFSFSFDMFYPDEFFYLLKIGVNFENM